AIVRNCQARITSIGSNPQAHGRPIVLGGMNVVYPGVSGELEGPLFAVLCSPHLSLGPFGAIHHRRNVAAAHVISNIVLEEDGFVERRGRTRRNVDQWRLTNPGHHELSIRPFALGVEAVEEVSCASRKAAVEGPAGIRRIAVARLTELCEP